MTQSALTEPEEQQEQEGNVDEAGEQEPQSAETENLAHAPVHDTPLLDTAECISSGMSFSSLPFSSWAAVVNDLYIHIGTPRYTYKYRYIIIYIPTYTYKYTYLY